MNVYVESLLSGLMVYWDEEKDAARYYIHLLIGEGKMEQKIINGRVTFVPEVSDYKEIAVAEVARNLKYYSFTNLGKIDQTEGYGHGEFRKQPKETGKNYYVYVEAEDKNGNIIDKSIKVMGKVYAISAGYFSQSK